MKSFIYLMMCGLFILLAETILDRLISVGDKILAVTLMMVAIIIWITFNRMVSAVKQEYPKDK